MALDTLSWKAMNRNEVISRINELKFDLREQIVGIQTNSEEAKSRSHPVIELQKEVQRAKVVFDGYHENVLLFASYLVLEWHPTADWNITFLDGESGQKSRWYRLIPGNTREFPYTVYLTSNIRREDLPRTDENSIYINYQWNDFDQDYLAALTSETIQFYNYRESFPDPGSINKGALAAETLYSEVYRFLAAAFVQRLAGDKSAAIHSEEQLAGALTDSFHQEVAKTALIEGANDSNSIVKVKSIGLLLGADFPMDEGMASALVQGLGTDEHSRCRERLSNALRDPTSLDVTRDALSEGARDSSQKISISSIRLLLGEKLPVNEKMASALVHGLDSAEDWEIERALSNAMIDEESEEVARNALRSGIKEDNRIIQARSALILLDANESMDSELAKIAVQALALIDTAERSEDHLQQALDNPLSNVVALEALEEGTRNSDRQVQVRSALILAEAGETLDKSMATAIVNGLALDSELAERSERRLEQFLNDKDSETEAKSALIAGTKSSDEKTQTSSERILKTLP
jgi:hypothetical protein